MSIGSLGQDQSSFANVSNITFDDITVINGVYGARFKSWEGGQCLAQNITWSNMRVYNVSFPIFVTQTYINQGGAGTQLENGTVTGRPNNSTVNMRDFRWENFTGTVNTYSHGDGSCVTDVSWFISLEMPLSSALNPFFLPIFRVFHPYPLHPPLTTLPTTALLVRRRATQPHAHRGRDRRMQHERLVPELRHVERGDVPAEPGGADRHLHQCYGGAESGSGLRVREWDVCAYCAVDVIESKVVEVGSYRVGVMWL